MSRPIRIVLVTLGLCAAGGVFGALAAAAAFLLAVVAIGKLPELSYDPQVLAWVAAVGAVFGGVLLPATGWLLLRRVPLGLAVLGTVAGTVLGGAAGGVVGWLMPDDRYFLAVPVLGALVGFLCAALLLRLRASAPRMPRGAAV